MDVGGVYDPNTHRYDHHQPSFTDTFSPTHTILLSSAGLVYKHFGHRLIQAHLPQLNMENIDNDSSTGFLFEKIYTVFVEPFDAHDNGISIYPEDLSFTPRYHSPCTLFDQVAWLNPAWNQPHLDANEQFQRAVALMKETFKQILQYYTLSWWPARSIVKGALAQHQYLDMNNHGILILDQHCPWTETLFELEEEMGRRGHYQYVVFSDGGGGWRVQAVPVAPESFLCRSPLPEGWRGKREDELDQATGIPGGVFVHRGGFIGGHRTKEGAMAMARLAIQSS